MKVQTSKGIANHTEPEPWGSARKSLAQASAGEDAGQVLSPEKLLHRSAAPVEARVGEIGEYDNARTRWTPRGRRPFTRIETTYTETGRRHERSWRDRTEVRAENPKGAMRG